MNKPQLTVSEINSKVRLKVTSRCNFDCTYCHEEGGQSSDIHADDKFRYFISELAALGVKKIQLTGGEPTLNPQLADLAEIICSIGLRCSLTTNGSFQASSLEKFKHSGIEDIHFSLNSMRRKYWEKFSRRNLNIYNNALDTQKSNIIAAQKLEVNCAVNLIVHNESSLQDLSDVYSFTKTNNVQLRVMTPFGDKNESIKAIEAFITGNNFEEIITVETLSSQRRLMRDQDGYEVLIKDIDTSIRLQGYCDDCRDTCREGFYGIRAEYNGKDFVLRFCLDRNDGHEVKSVSEFKTFLINNK